MAPRIRPSPSQPADVFVKEKSRDQTFQIDDEGVIDITAGEIDYSHQINLERLFEQEANQDPFRLRPYLCRLFRHRQLNRPTAQHGGDVYM